MNVYSHSERGNHPANEDAISSYNYDGKSDVIVCVLADGQGGRSGGGLAAQHAVATCLELATTYSPGALLRPLSWIAIGERVDQSVAKHSEAGFTTFIGLVVTPSFTAGVSSGDSAVVLMLGNECVVLTERQRKNPPVGSGQAHWEPFSARLAEQWKIVVMSDGVWKYAGWDAVVRRCRSATGPALISSLRAEAVANSGPQLQDDYSVILVEP